MITPKSSVGAVIAALKACHGADVYVSTEVPDPRPEAYIRVSRIGGEMVNRFEDGALLLIECFAADGVVAESVCNISRGYLAESAPSQRWANVWVYGYAERQGPVNFPDPDTDDDRYQFMGVLYTDAT